MRLLFVVLVTFLSLVISGCQQTETNRRDNTLPLRLVKDETTVRSYVSTYDTGKANKPIIIIGAEWRF